MVILIWLALFAMMAIDSYRLPVLFFRSVRFFVSATLEICVRSEERRVGKECISRWSRIQAEDGIRDGHVTGVQTCALPILNFLQTIRMRGEFFQFAVKFLLHGNIDLVGSFCNDGNRLIQIARFVLQVSQIFCFCNIGNMCKIGRASCRERVYISMVADSSRRRHTRWPRDWSSDVCSSDLEFPPDYPYAWRILPVCCEVPPSW